MARGFTLVEIAVVMMIVALLLGSLMYTLAQQIDQRAVEETRSRLEAARQLLLAFAIVNGRLPCPAIATSSGDEWPNGGGTCSPPNNYAGFLPARAIGYQIVDANGFAVDSWQNRIRYAVSVASPDGCTPTQLPHFTATTPMIGPHIRVNGITCQPNDLVVCSRSPAVVTDTTCDAGTAVTNQKVVVALVFSTGKNGATGGTGTNEARNLDNNRLFVSRAPDAAGAAGGEFDDQMVWISVGELYGRMISAGVLP